MPKSRVYLAVRGFMALCLLVVGSCTTHLPVQPGSGGQLTPPSWPAHRAKMQAITHWQLKGKLAYRNDKKSGSASLDWTQRGDNFTIYLSGPLGVGTVEINASPQLITLNQPGKTSISAPTATTLTERLFGWQLPVEQILYWVRGIPATTSGHTLKGFNTQGLLSTLHEQGWHITMERYQTTARGHLPGKVKGYNENLSFTLILKEWTLVDKQPADKTSTSSSK